MTESLAVLFVLLLLGGVLWLLQKRGSIRIAADGPKRMEAIERLRLGPNHTLHLIRVRDRELLVVTHGSGCTMLGSTSGHQETTLP